ncbi:MAG: aldehyde dehydrogenase family protein, partial [Chloroflexi bacterium]|nr:aldehyde dehydrogenase family protein [Chloroflexota bacterium]
MEQYKLFINGKFIDAASGKTFESIDPGTETPIATVAQAGKADAEAAIAAARKAFNSGVWSGLTPAARMAKVQDFADQVSQQALRLTATECMDSGQILKLAGFAPLLGVGLLRNLALTAATKFP